MKLTEKGERIVRRAMLFGLWVSRLNSRARGTATPGTILRAASVMADQEYAADEEACKDRRDIMAEALTLSEANAEIQRQKKDAQKTIDRLCDSHPTTAKLLGYRHSRELAAEAEAARKFRAARRKCCECGNPINQYDLEENRFSECIECDLWAHEKCAQTCPNCGDCFCTKCYPHGIIPCRRGER